MEVAPAAVAVAASNYVEAKGRVQLGRWAAEASGPEVVFGYTEPAVLHPSAPVQAAPQPAVDAAAPLATQSVWDSSSASSSAPPPGLFNTAPRYNTEIEAEAFGKADAESQGLKDDGIPESYVDGGSDGMMQGGMTADGGADSWGGRGGMRVPSSQRNGGARPQSTSQSQAAAGKRRDASNGGGGGSGGVSGGPAGMGPAMSASGAPKSRSGDKRAASGAEMGAMQQQQQQMPPPYYGGYMYGGADPTAAYMYAAAGMFPRHGAMMHSDPSMGMVYPPGPGGSVAASAAPSPSATGGGGGGGSSVPAAPMYYPYQYGMPMYHYPYSAEPRFSGSKPEFAAPSFPDYGGYGGGGFMMAPGGRPGPSVPAGGSAGGASMPMATSSAAMSASQGSASAPVGSAPASMGFYQQQAPPQGGWGMYQQRF